MAIGSVLRDHILLTLPAGSALAVLIYTLVYPNDKFFILTWTCIILYPSALLSLSFAVTDRSTLQPARNKAPKSNNAESTIIVTLTRINGVLTSSLLFSLPETYHGDSPISHCLLRVACFFYACKLLDLTVARASSPPILLHDDKEVSVSNWTQRLRYTYLLVTEFRYRSFDIAVVEKGRAHAASKSWTYGIPAIILPLAYLVPTAETLFLLVLSIIYLALEAIHSALHPSCPYPQFWQPFAATSFTSFWSVHWHQGARPFLYHLGYVPAERIFTPLFGREVGSAVGVLATFSLSGIWHGWAAAAVMEEPWMMGVWMWAIFVGHGVACILERWLARKGVGGGWAHRVITWVVAVGTVAMWVREGLVRVKVWVPWPP